MVIIENKPLTKAVADQKKKYKTSALKIVVDAGSSYGTLRKLKKGDADLNLAAIDRLAGHLGFDTVVRFVKRTEPVGAAG